MPAIVFDLDGTLIDSAPDIMTVANRILSTEGAAPLTLPETRSFIGNGAAVLVSRMMGARGLPKADHARLLATFMATFDDEHGQTVLYPGVSDALNALTSAGYALGICTNKPASAARSVLDHLDLSRHFQTMIGDDGGKHRKPHPAPLLRAFANLPSGPQLYVGDSEVDHQTALAANAPFALFTEGYRRTPLDQFPGATQFSHFDALPGLAARLLA